MGGSASKPSPVLATAIDRLGPAATERCRKRFAELGAGQPTVGCRAVFAGLGILSSVPPIQQIFLSSALNAELRATSQPGTAAPPAIADMMTEASFLLFMSKVSDPDRDARRFLFLSTIKHPEASTCVILAQWTDTTGCGVGSERIPRVWRAGAPELEALLVAAAGDDLGSDPATMPYLLWEALKMSGKEGSLGQLREQLSDAEFSQFLDRCPLAEALLDELFFEAGGFGGLVEPPHSLVRARGGPRFMAEPSRLLSPAVQTLLEWSLPRGKQAEWELLFSSTRDGASFQRLKSCIDSKGSTLLVIRDKGGHVFGGFAFDSWKAHSDFYGHDATFLFSVEPSMRVYRPSGINPHYQYFNSLQETLPNGLAFGGQFDYFGLYVSGEYDTGHSKGHPLSSTFANPVLSHEQEFRVAEIEVWRVGPEERDEVEIDDDGEDEDGDGPKVGKSILDKAHAGDKVVLELAGRKMHSEDLRAPIEDEPVVYRADGKVKRPVY